MDPYSKAKTELSDIDAQIVALQRRRDALREFISLGESLFRDALASDATAATSDPGAIKVRVRNPIRVQGDRLKAHLERMGSTKDRVLHFCADHIRTHGQTRTWDLFDALKKADIHIGGSDPVAGLSVMLSKSGQFNSDRKFGWSLKEEAPQDAPTSAGLCDV